ncbi:MAG TPA: NADPH-dependent F420 reductase, partial [Solirubrobacteraceae bacterium]|nr:NADPH-dependent F420 reductase [Solirubrobacteraceae bacterium]
MPSSPTEPVAVIGGSGALGYGVAVRLARAGTPVVIGSREEQRAADTATRAIKEVPEATIEGRENAGAAAAVKIVILSVPFASQAATMKSLKEALQPGTLLIDATVPLAAAVGGSPTRMLGVAQGSAAQQAADLAPEGVRVVSALHTVSAASLADLGHPLDQDVLVCGDSRADKRDAATVIERIPGLRCV